MADPSGGNLNPELGNSLFAKRSVIEDIPKEGI
jgi:hypothetical protein